MNRLVLLSWIACASPFAALADYTLIDFNPQAASAPNSINLSGIGDSPYTIGNATFFGGQLVNNYVTLFSLTTGIQPDTTGLYADMTPSGPDFTNPMVITFAAPVYNFSLLVINYDGFAVPFEVADNLGDSSTMVLDPFASNGGAATFSLAGAGGITSVTITERTSGFPFSDYSFGIDNVAFTVAPEPAVSGFAFLSGAFLLALWRRHARGNA